MKEKSNEKQAVELKGEFTDAREVFSEELSDTKKEFRENVIEEAKANGELEEAKVDSLADGKAQVEELKNVKAKEKRKHTGLKTALYSLIIGTIVIGGAGALLVFNQPKQTQNNTPDYEEVIHKPDDGDEEKGDTNTNVVVDAGQNTGSGSYSNRNVKPNSNEIIPNINTTQDTKDKNLYEVTGGTSNHVTIEEDNQNNKDQIDAAKNDGKDVTGIGDDITVVVDNNTPTPVNPSTPQPIVPSDPDIPASIDIDNNVISVPSTQNEVAPRNVAESYNVAPQSNTVEPTPVVEEPVQVKTEEPQQADDKTLDEMFEMTR